MLLSELIIIYLAAAAPFGVAYFLRQPASVSRTRSLLHASGAALLWPFSLLSRSLVHKNFRRASDTATATPEVSSAHERRIENARRALLSSLYRTGDLAEEVSGLNTEATQAAVRETLASVERYVGLALAVADADEAAAASLHAPRETELCRIGGRTGDDLHIAELCHGRRNISRLRAHAADSRVELLHAFAELREIFESTLAATRTDPQVVAARPLFAALLETYLRAIALLSLLEDEQAAARIVRLLDAVRARLHWVESLNAQAAPESPIQTETTGSVAGDKPCTTSLPPTQPQPQLSRPQTIRMHG